MARSRFWCLSVLSLAAAVAIADTGHSQQNVTYPPASPKASPADVAGASSKIYSLADLGDDPKLGNWVADTILAVIEPESWTHDGNYQPLKGADQKARRALSYYAPSKVMVVYHTPAVHAKVDEFLKDLKKATAATAAKAKKPATVDPAVQQAQFVPAPMPTPPGYPVAGPLQQPKHLFHFIIRYEGDGILDANVVEFAKALQSAVKSEATTNAGPPVQAVPCASPPPNNNGPTNPGVAVPPPTIGTAPPPPPSNGQTTPRY